MDHLDFELLPWDTEDPETGKTEVIYVEDKNILRRIYKIKNIYEKQKVPNSNNWNFGSVPPELLSKKKT